MGDAACVGHGLRATAFVLGARDAILRPDLHGHADHVVAFFPQEVTGHARIDAAAHTEQDALFLGNHGALKVTALFAGVNRFCVFPVRTGTLTNGLSARVNRQGKSFARLMPMRGSATTGVDAPSSCTNP